MSEPLRIDWTAPAADVHDELVERYCERHPEYNPEADEFHKANTYADFMISLYLA